MYMHDIMSSGATHAYGQHAQNKSGEPDLCVHDVLTGDETSCSPVCLVES